MARGAVAYLVVLVIPSLVLSVSPVWGGVINGDFEFALGAEWNTVGAVTRTEEGVVVLSESEHGGLSYISQSFVLPAGSKTVSFRYRFLHGKNERDSLVPPDSLMVFLTNNDSGLPMAAFDGWYANTAFYTDSDGVQQFDTSSVAIIGPDNDKSYWVRVQTGAIAVNTNVTIEIGLACADNGVSSFAVIDDVSVDCPPKWCCDSVDEWVAEIDDNDVCTKDVCDDSTGEVTRAPVPIDDGDPCTADSCDPLDGVLNEPILYCGTDIIFMLDGSGSISDSDWVKMKMWVRNIVEYYSTLPNPPRVGVGRFCHSLGYCSVGGDANHCAAKGIELLANCDLLDLVFFGDEDLPNCSGIERASNCGTNLAFGIQAAVAHFLEKSGEHRRKCVIFLTDGWINEIGNYSCPDAVGDQNVCQSRYARCHAESVDTGDIEVFIAHFESGADYLTLGCCDSPPVGDCSDEYTEVVYWLKHNIVSGNNETEREAHMFYDILDNVSVEPPYDCPGCAIPLKCSQDSDCNDGRDCTVDSCADGFCVLDGSGCE